MTDYYVKNGQTVEGPLPKHQAQQRAGKLSEECANVSILKDTDIRPKPNTGDGSENNDTGAKVYFDGAARDNPGHAGFGIHIQLPTPGTGERGAAESVTYNGYIGDDITNNEAEYKALLNALQAAKRNDVSRLEIYGDSQLVVKQIQGEWSVNADNLEQFHRICRIKLNQFKSWEINHIPREENEVADQCANEAIDNHHDEGSKQVTSSPS